jgi:Tfp pilus assembly protein PilO
MNLSIREKVMLLTLCLVAVVFLGIKFLISPAMGNLSADKTKFLQMQLKVSNAQSTVLTAKGMDIKTQNAYEDAKTAAAPLFPSLDKPSLNVWLFKLAEAKGLTIETTSLGDPSASSNNSAAAPSGTSTASTGAGTDTSNLTYLMKTYADQYFGKAVPQNSKNSKSSTTNQTNALTSTVTMPFIGSYSDFKSFLDAIRETKRSIVVSSFDCSNKNAAFSCNITLQFYAAEKLDNTDSIFDWSLPKPAGQKDLM